MTDKELKKLSRLELLELLLDVSQENKILEEKVQKLTVENEKAKSIENLATATKQVNDMLGYATALTGAVKTGVPAVPPAKIAPVTLATSNPVINKKQADRNLFLRLIEFYKENDAAIELLPDDMKKDIADRIAQTAEDSKNNG